MAGDTVQCREWVRQAMGKIEADFNRSSDTHLIKLDFPVCHGVQLYLKDETTHPSGSLKHRLARSLFLYGLSNGWITKGTTIIESSSGSTAISEACFARLLGLPFIAVVPKTTAPEKLAKIEFYGGKCHLVDGPKIYEESERLARELNGHYMDQFTFAERATDWRGNNNIADSIFSQMRREPHAIPRWIVVGAGTGGTSATIGRYLRYHTGCGASSQLCVVDPENSVFTAFHETRDRTLTSDRGSQIEGIGRPRVEPSFIPDVVDRMIPVPDAASFAAAHLLEDLLGRKCGPSTGTNLVGVFRLMSDMRATGEEGSIVSLICDPGERYLDSCYSADWLKARGLDIDGWRSRLDTFLKSGEWVE